jgi:hypothetical protein
MGRRVSHTQREAYELCPYKYKLRYIDRYKSTIESSALVFGNALDNALNDMLLGKDSYHETFDSEWGKCADLTIEYYKSDLDVSLLSPEELTLPKSQQNFLSLARKGHKLLDAYKLDIMPRIKNVISVQGEMLILGYDEFGEPTEDSITGKLDLVAVIEDDNKVERTAVLDNKTTSSPYPKNSVQKKDQLPLYAQAFPDIEWFGYLTMNKKTYDTQVILDKVDETRKEEVLQKFVTMLDNIRDNKFEKNLKSCFSFGRRCEYWTHCHRGYFDSHIYKEEK